MPTAGTLWNFPAPIDFHGLDPKTNMFVPVADEAQIKEIARQISPITHVSGSEKDLALFADWFDEHLKKGVGRKG